MFRTKLGVLGCLCAWCVLLPCLSRKLPIYYAHVRAYARVVRVCRCALEIVRKKVLKKYVQKFGR